jgi:hypothetical protein
MAKSEPDGSTTALGRWIHNHIVQSVPEDIALCEYDCRKLECSMGEWEHCERRKQHLRTARDP